MDTGHTTTLTYGSVMDRYPDEFDTRRSVTISESPCYSRFLFREPAVTDYFGCESREAYLARLFRETHVFLLWKAGIKRLLFGRWLYPSSERKHFFSVVHGRLRPCMKLSPSVWRVRNFRKLISRKSPALFSRRSMPAVVSLFA